MGTIAEKLAKVEETKAALKSAINGSGSVVGDVFDEYPTAITTGKSAIAQAITDKGVSTEENATFQQMAENIGGIESILMGSYIPLDNPNDFFNFPDAILSIISESPIFFVPGVSWLEANKDEGIYFQAYSYPGIPPCFIEVQNGLLSVQYSGDESIVYVDLYNSDIRVQGTSMFVKAYRRKF